MQQQDIVPSWDCAPTGWCSWNYEVIREADPEPLATVSTKALSESGAITIGDETFAIVKQGWFRSEWNVMADSQSVMAARLVSFWCRSIDLTVGEQTLELRPVSWFSRKFELRHSGELLLKIEPTGWITRRAKVTFPLQEADVRLACFALWLVIAMWRRAQSNS